jgi:hypothetical protein
MVEDSRTDALERMRARRGEEPIEAAIDRLLPTFMEVAMADAMAFAMKGGGSLPAESAASALGARSRTEMRLYVADWILRAELSGPQSRDQDAPLADRIRMFEDVCRLGFAEIGLPTGVRRRRSRRGGVALLLGLMLVLLGIYVYNR